MPENFSNPETFRDPDTELTPEEIAQKYSAANDSVTVINELVQLDILTDEQIDTIRRNVDHLKIMVDKQYWITQDLSPFHTAIAAGEMTLSLQ
jgi:hypothetical protein